MSETSKQVEPVMCAGKCGFYGNAATNNYCSKCWRDKHGAAKPVTESVAEDPASPQVEAKATEVVPAVIQLAKPEQKNKFACFSCRRKVGYLGFKCRCEYVFCAEHRYPHEHNCSVDVKKIQQSVVAKANPKVETEKLDKL